MLIKRSVVLCIIFSIITCGIYTLYWFVCLTNDTNQAADQPDTSGGAALLLTIITCGIYGFFWAYRRGEQLDVAKQKRGLMSSNSSFLYLLLFLLGGGIIAFAIIQHELNKLD